MFNLPAALIRSFQEAQRYILSGDLYLADGYYPHPVAMSIQIFGPALFITFSLGFILAHP